MIIGLTGGIASGKSTVSKIIRSMRLPVICADTLAHQVIKPKQIAYKKIVKAFGPEILHKNKTINRAALGKIVFNSEKKRKILEKIVHPEVRLEIQRKIEQYKKSPLCVLDVPLLYETGLSKLCDIIIVVYAPESIMKKRLKLRDGFSKSEIEKRLLSQMPIEKKKKLTPYIIDNSKSLDETKRQVKSLIKQILKDS